MKTTHLILSALVATFFATSFAGELITVDSKQNVLVIEARAVDGISTAEGEFADLQGLKNGLLNAAGVDLSGGKIKIDLSKIGSKLDSIYLNNGKILSLGRGAVSAAQGGEMGGGGK